MAYDKLLLFKECPLFLSLFLVRPTGSPTQRKIQTLELLSLTGRCKSQLFLFLNQLTNLTEPNLKYDKL